TVKATVEGIGAKLPSISGANYYSGLNGSTYAIANSASGEELVTFSGPASTNVITIHYGFGNTWKNEAMTYDGTNFTATIPLATDGMPTQWVYYDNTTEGWYHSTYGPQGGLVGFMNPGNFVDLPYLSVWGYGVYGAKVQAQVLPNGSVFTLLSGVYPSSSVTMWHGVNASWSSNAIAYSASLGGFAYTITANAATGVQWMYIINGSKDLLYNPTSGGNFGIANLVNGYVTVSAGGSPSFGFDGFNTGASTNDSVSIAESLPNGIFVWLNGPKSRDSLTLWYGYNGVWSSTSMVYSGTFHGFIATLPKPAYNTFVQYNIVISGGPTIYNATDSDNFVLHYQPYGLYQGLNGSTHAQV
ncbi:MAG: hypothetical protein ACP5UL_06805, partial [Thermoplasmata archaeon]